MSSEDRSDRFRGIKTDRVLMWDLDDDAEPPPAELIQHVTEQLSEGSPFKGELVGTPLSGPNPLQEIWDKSGDKPIEQPVRFNYAGDYRPVDFVELEAKLLAYVATKRKTSDHGMMSYCMANCYATKPDFFPKTFTDWRKKRGWLFAIHWWFERWCNREYGADWHWKQENPERNRRKYPVAGYEIPFYMPIISWIEFRLRGWSDPRTRNEPTWKRLLSVFRSGSPK